MIDAERWEVRRRRGVLEVGYGRRASYPQCAALHLRSGYFRLTYPGGGWGTSIVVVPSFWMAGRYHQGARLSAGWSVDAPDLVLAFTSRFAGLTVAGEVRLAPPRRGLQAAAVQVRVSGAPAIDDRPGEAFKPVTLSSMRTAPDRWDACATLFDERPGVIPEGGPLAGPLDPVHRFGLLGGCSSWKQAAPTVEVELVPACVVAGWVTPSENPNDDNVAIWAATAELLPAWRYRVTARDAAPVVTA
jgi:hypothetical protein